MEDCDTLANANLVTKEVVPVETAKASFFQTHNLYACLMQKIPDIDECATLTNPCPNPHTKCLNTFGSYLCECEKGWEPIVPNMPQPVACHDVDECATGKYTFKVNCRCINNEGNYSYAPLPGFKMDGDQCVGKMNKTTGQF